MLKNKPAPKNGVGLPHKHHKLPFRRSNRSERNFSLTPKIKPAKLKLQIKFGREPAIPLGAAAVGPGHHALFLGQCVGAQAGESHEAALRGLAGRGAHAGEAADEEAGDGGLGRESLEDLGGHDGRKHAGGGE